MRNSNLAECLEDFAAAVIAVDEPKDKAPPVFAVVNPGRERRPPRRLSFHSRRIQIRDPGLPRFRVF